MAPDRTEPISLRMSKVEVQKLKALAGARDVSQSDIIRMLILEAWDEKFGQKAPPKPKR